MSWSVSFFFGIVLTVTSSLKVTFFGTFLLSLLFDNTLTILSPAFLTAYSPVFVAAVVTAFSAPFLAAVFIVLISNNFEPNYLNTSVIPSP